MSERTDKRICDDWRCGWRGSVLEVLTAPDPFNDGVTLHACPQCREQTISTACDEPDCWNGDTCGTPTATGDRWTCGEHIPEVSFTTEQITAAGELLSRFGVRL